MKDLDSSIGAPKKVPKNIMVQTTKILLSTDNATYDIVQYLSSINFQEYIVVLLDHL